MRLETTPYGFIYGAAEVERTASEPKLGVVYLRVRTPKRNQTVTVRVTKTGQTRVYKNGVELK